MLRPENPPLFARDYENDGETIVYETRITLLDIIAAAIANGWCAAMGRGEHEDTDSGWRERFSRDSYDLAQAMLDERHRRATGGLRRDDDVDIPKNQDGE